MDIHRRIFATVFAAALVVGLAACKDNETTTAPGAIANVAIEAPDSAHSGQSFTFDVKALNVGINNVRDGRVEVTLPAPLSVTAVETSEGTSATFSNGAAASAVHWILGTLDSNSQSRLHITATGILPPGSAGESLMLSASLTAAGVRDGDAVAHATLQLMP